jgi:hypothetical protein
MPYSLEIAERPGYLHAKVTGNNTKENVMRYMDELARECDKSRFRCVLIEEQLEGPRLDTMSVFDIATDGSQKSRVHFRAVAYVDVCAESSSMKNAETFATNRGLNIKVFERVDEAEKWLAGFVT